MEHTLSVLRGAKDIAGTLPIPYVDTAVGVALNIIQLAKVRLINNRFEPVDQSHLNAVHLCAHRK